MVVFHPRFAHCQILSAKSVDTISICFSQSVISASSCLAKISLTNLSFPILWYKWILKTLQSVLTNFLSAPTVWCTYIITEEHTVSHSSFANLAYFHWRAYVPIAQHRYISTTKYFESTFLVSAKTKQTTETGSSFYHSVLLGRHI